jgi:hypothetical protein
MGLQNPLSNTRFDEIQVSMNIASQAQRDYQVTRFDYKETDSISPCRPIKPRIL